MAVEKIGHLDMLTRITNMIAGASTRVLPLSTPVQRDTRNTKRSEVGRHAN